MPDETTPWVVKGVSERTRRRVKAYAADNGFTMAEAIERIVNMALGDEADQKSIAIRRSDSAEAADTLPDEEIIRLMESDSTIGRFIKRMYEQQGYVDHDAVVNRIRHQVEESDLAAIIEPIVVSIMNRWDEERFERRKREREQQGQ